MKGKKKDQNNDQCSMTNDQDENKAVEVKEVIKEVEVNVDYKDEWLRAQADYQNLVKEVDARRAEWAQYSGRQILEEFVPVYDNFKKAFASDTDTQINADVADNADNVKNFKNWKKGIECIKKQFETVLKNHGVEQIKTVGEKFNPEFHEAVGEEELVEFGEGKVLREVEAGYLMRGRVIKVAKVIVSKLK